MVNILECIRQGQIGGGESHLLSLVENMDRSRFEPIVLSFTDGPMIERLNSMNVKTFIIPTLKPFDITKWKEVKRLMERENISLVHAHGTRAASNVFWATGKLDIPLIYTVHGWSFHDDQKQIVKKIRVLGEKLLTSKADVNISVSKSNRQTGLNHFKGFKSVVVNNGIDQTKFDPSKTTGALRHEFGFNNNHKVVLFIARFTAHKQPLTLIKAFAEAAKKDAALRLLMIGDGDEKEKALSMVNELGIKNEVVFESFRQDVPEILASADIFVLPSLWEGLPIGLLEAMSMGKAVIATNVDGTKEVITDKVNGILINVADLEKELPGAILQLAGDEQLRNSFGSQARLTVKDHFNAVTMTKHIEGIYSELLNRKPHK